MTKLQELYFAIQDRGGFSVRHDLNKYEGGGYAVGGASECIEILVNTMSWNSFKSIMSALRKETQGTGLSRIIGGWVDIDNVAYLEISDIVQDRAEAIALGKERGEIAIYDFGKNEEIRIK